MSISLIVAAHDRAAFVAAAVGSILRQTRSDFELVVWDDGSTDRTADLSTRAAGNDPRVRVLRAPHRGVCASLNAAAHECTRRYIGWIDSDDALAPTALERTAAVLDARPEVGVVYTQHRTMDEAGVLGPVGARCLIPYSPQRLLVDFMTFQFRLMRRELFDRVGGIDETIPYAEDYDLCLKLSEITQFAHVPEPLYFYRQHAGALSSTHRVEQILASQEAIRRALVRRGLADEYEIRVHLAGRYSLRGKALASPGAPPNMPKS